MIVSTSILRGEIPASALSKDSLEWWISFGELFEISGSYGYLTSPYFAMDAALSEQGSQDTISFNGLYVSAPLKEQLPTGISQSIVAENPGMYPNTNLPPITYISTAKSGFLCYHVHEATNANYIVFPEEYGFFFCTLHKNGGVRLYLQCP